MILEILKRIFLGPQDLPDPKDRIKENQINVTGNKVEINQKGVIWSRIANTESMNPVIDQGHHALFIAPEQKDLQIGDIISFYRERDSKTNVMHRIISIGTDEQGWYAITKGDNCFTNDGKVRFKNIKKVLIGIIY